MAFAYVLNLDGTVFGDLLQQVRLIGNPLSKSKPHVTVRYPIDKLKHLNTKPYDELVVSSLLLADPGMFKRCIGQIVNYTIHIRCESDVLETWSYKPDFPDSVFHVTLYDGPNYEYASRLLDILREFEWYKIFHFSPRKLTRIEINHRRSRAVKQGVPSGGSSVSVKLGESLLGSPESLSRVRRLLGEVNRFGRTSRAASIKPVIRALEPVGADQSSIQASMFSESLYELGVQDDLSKRARDSEKDESGLFLTPPEVAIELSEYALKLCDGIGPIRWGDPALGSGALFAAFQLVCPPERMSDSIGIELKKQRARQTASRWRSRGLNVFYGDVLSCRLPSARNLLIANPPYIRARLLSLEMRRRWQVRIYKDLGIKVSLQASLFAYFVLICDGWLDMGGLGVWLLPHEFLHTRYGRCLREYLSTKVELLNLHHYGPSAEKFEDAEVSSVAVIFRKHPPRKEHCASISMGSNLSNPEHLRHVSSCDLFTNENWQPTRLFAMSGGIGGKKEVREVAVVTRGIATGRNRLFVLKGNQVASERLEAACLVPVLSSISSVSEQQINGRTLYRADFKRLEFLVSSSRPLAELRAAYPNVAAYLDGIQGDAMESHLVRRRKRWYQQEVRTPGHIFFPVLFRKRKFVSSPFIWSDSPIVATNAFLMIAPSAPYADAETYRMHSRLLYEILIQIDLEECSSYLRGVVGDLMRAVPASLGSMPIKKEINIQF